jgi:hypothetical protein
MSRLAADSGCTSATLYQLRENLYRAAYHQPSLQKERVAIKGAEQESDPAQEFVAIPE